MSLSKNNRAFTLIEAIVVITILSIMAIAIVPAYRSYNRRNQLREAAQAVRSAIVEAQNTALAPKQIGGDWQYGVQIDKNNKTYTVYRKRPSTNPETLRSYTLPDSISWSPDTWQGQLYFTPPNAKSSCNNTINIKIQLDAANVANVQLNCTTGQTNTQ
jgi:prepilin-type N-terminal cleavage/methylation domain-containing protein